MRRKRESCQPTGARRDDETVPNQTIQAILEISAEGEDDRWIMPEKHDVNESITVIEQCTAFGNFNIGISFGFVMHRKSGVVMPTTKFGPEVKAGRILGTVFAAFGDNIAHLRREEKS